MLFLCSMNTYKIIQEYENRLRISREWKERNRLYCQAYNTRFRNRYRELYYYNTLKASAKKRSLPFTLTFGQFLNLIRWYPYFFIRNIPHRLWYSIDRRDNLQGYTADNCQVLLIYENSQKAREDERRGKI
jgi:hypothetical protein